MSNSHFTNLLIKSVKLPPFRRTILKKMDRELHRSIVENDKTHLKAIQEKRYDFVDSMLHMAIGNLDKGWITSKEIEKLSGIFVENTMLSNIASKREIRDKFKAEHGFSAPNFITISPSQACNLHCYGCYACSEADSSPHLPFDVVDRIIGETRDKWGASFVVVSGGEPYMYRDGGKTLVDLFEKYPDMFFMTYTNGTLIDEKMAKRFAELGNVSPAISVEGFEKETDGRRGKGTYGKVLKAFDNLRKAGVPFGISVTATSRNCETLLKDDFYDFYFEQQGATYMWQFQFMPIGRGKGVFDLVVPPDKRVLLYRKWETQMHEKKHCIADFWNSGVLTHGCVAYGGNRGYIYIDWNGDIMPCVFVPYSADNILKLFEEGKTMTDALMNTFMRKGRIWQNEYSINDKMHPQNLLMPCSIRDHYINFSKNILTAQASGENNEADEIMSDGEYLQKMDEYDRKLSSLTQPIWEKDYLRR